jgi:hypothetical protein
MGKTEKKKKKERDNSSLASTPCVRYRLQAGYKFNDDVFGFLSLYPPEYQLIGNIT